MAVSFYLVLFFAAGNDIMAIKLSLSINDITNFFRAAVFVVPPLVFWVTKRICLSLQRADREKVLHGRETGTIMRTAEGRFYEVHEDLDEYERWKLVAFESSAPLALTSSEDANGVARRKARRERRRARVSHFYFKDRVEPVTPAELAAAHHHGEHEAIEAPAAAGGGAPETVKRAPEGD
jgi:ubiquinol-cytochrome c reductase cytochrome b subunit